jgi:hypothetical protein
MKLSLSRIFSIFTLVTSVIALYLVLEKPAPVAPPLTPAAAAVSAQSFETKVEQLAQPQQPGEPPAEVRLTSDEVSAAFAQAAGAIPPAAAAPAAPAQGLTNSSASTPDAPIAPGQPEIKGYQVNFDGDLARGQFVTQVSGKDVYVTLAGRLGSRDGYVTFDPTEFKVGDLTVPVSLVNDALQKKLAEQRDRLKLPEGVDALRVEHGELVLTQK